MDKKIFLVLAMTIFCTFHGSATRTGASPDSKRLAQDEIATLPEEFWKAGFVLNGCKVQFPCKLIDLMQAGDYTSSARDKMIPPTGENEYWSANLTNAEGEKIDVALFNPTTQKLHEADCPVNSIRIGSHSDGRYIVPDFAVFGLISKEATREEMIEAVGKYCGAPAYIVECPNWDLYQFYDKKPTKENPADWSNIKIEIMISKTEGACYDKMVGFEFNHVGKFYRDRENSTLTSNKTASAKTGAFFVRELFRHHRGASMQRSPSGH